MKNILLILALFPKVVGDGELSGNFKFITPVVNKVEVEVVTLTTYSPIEGETDSTPNITASGFKIDLDNPKKHKIIAVSRDLKRKWKFNQKVRIRKAGKYNGVYTVKDVMNKRYKNRIDVLIGGGDKQTKIRNVKISPIKLEDSSK
jgi:3D (Asp-Asp-Asp) domain-containing protein